MATFMATTACMTSEITLRVTTAIHLSLDGALMAFSFTAGAEFKCVFQWNHDFIWVLDPTPRYTKKTQLGVDADLDDCGGHVHEDYDYHYHPSVETGMSSINPSDFGKNFTAYWAAPKCSLTEINVLHYIWYLFCFLDFQCVSKEMYLLSPTFGEQPRIKWITTPRKTTMTSTSVLISATCGLAVALRTPTLQTMPHCRRILSFVVFFEIV